MSTDPTSTSRATEVGPRTHARGDGWATACGQDRANVRNWTDDLALVTCPVCRAGLLREQEPAQGALTEARREAMDWLHGTDRPGGLDGRFAGPLGLVRALIAEADRRLLAARGGTAAAGDEGLRARIESATGSMRSAVEVGPGCYTEEGWHALCVRLLAALDATPAPTEDEREAMRYARGYWRHGQEPRTQHALTVLAQAVERLAARGGTAAGQDPAPAQDTGRTPVAATPRYGMVYRCQYDGLNPAGCCWSTTNYAEIDAHEEQAAGHFVVGRMERLD